MTGGSSSFYDPAAERWLRGVTDRIWSTLRKDFSSKELARFADFIKIIHGDGFVPANDTNREVYRRLYYPGLDVGPFLSPQDCGVFIKPDELDRICRESVGAFDRSNDIVDQTEFVVSHDDRSDDLRWDCVHLRKQGVDCAAHIEKFPVSASFVFRHRVGFEAIFSRLSPGACLDPHSDDANYVVNVALPLHDSEALISAGGKTLPYRRGEIICLEPSFMHSVINTRAGSRDVLLFDIWHPCLTDVEVEGMLCLRRIWEEESEGEFVFDPQGGPYRRSA